MTTNGRVGWGLLATGWVAAEFVKGIHHSETGRLAAVASRDARRAASFAAEHGASAAYCGYEDLLRDPSVDVVYVSTPHALHAEWVIKAADAGKHVLCEKPLALNHSEATTMIEAARRNDVFLMEGFMYRVHPQTSRLIGLLRDGAIGRLQLVDIAESFWADSSAPPRLVDRDLGGGGILDVGCYCTSMALLVATVATRTEETEPTEVIGLGYIDPHDGIDYFAVASMCFPGEFYAQLSCGVRLAEQHRLRIFGEDGYIDVPSPSWVSFLPQHSEIVVTRHGEDAQVVEVEAANYLFAYEVDHVGAHLADRQSPAMTWDNSLASMRTLDRWRRAVGLSFERDKAPDPKPRLEP